jgi:arylsulfatase
MMMAAAPATAQPAQKPNIVVIMGDDIGMWNIGAYHRGMMAGRTPNLDQIAAEGMIFTDYYAEASCTAGRANFITGELPIRTGMTTVGQAGAAIGIPAQAVTIATALKGLGYATGQFGKNHLGDKRDVRPCRGACDTNALCELRQTRCPASSTNNSQDRPRCEARHHGY